MTPTRSCAEQRALILLLRAIREALYETPEHRLPSDEMVRAIRAAFREDAQRRLLRKP